MNMSNPRVINKRGGGETDGAIALFLRDFPTFCVGGVFFGSSFLFALQFPLVRVCFGPTFRLAFCPQWGLIGIDSFCHCICLEGGFPFPLLPLHHVLNGLSGLTFFGCLSENFNAISLKSRQATSYFSPVYVCVLRLIFSSINPFYTLTKDPLKHLSNIQLQIYLSVMTNSFVSTSVASLVSR